MKRWRRYVVAAVVAASMLVVGSCGGDDTLEPREAALAALMDNDYVGAEAQLDALLAVSPSDEALHLAAALAALGQSVDQLNYVIGLIFSADTDLEAIADLSSEKPGWTTVGVDDENTFILGLLREILDTFAAPLDRALTHLAAVQSPATRLHLEQMELLFLQYPFVDLSGVWDAADARVLEAVLGPIAALLHVIRAHDLNLDVYLAVHNLLGPEGFPDLPGLGNLIVQLLESPGYTEFLRIDQADRDGDGDADGPVALALAQARAQRGFAAFAEALAALAARTGDDSGVFTLRQDDGETYLALIDRVRLDGEGNFDFSGVGTYATFEVQVTDAWRAAAANWAANLAGNQVRLGLSADVWHLLLPPLLAIVSHLDLGETVDAVLELVGASPDAAVSLIESFVPDALELDPAAWFAAGVGLRPLIPLYRTDLELRANNFLFEWECPGFFAPTATDPVGSTGAWPAGRLTCPDKDDEDLAAMDPEVFALSDAAHFGSVTHAAVGVAEIAADGVAHPWPVIPWSDPSIGGLLYVDARAVIKADPKPAAGAMLADNRSLNAFIAAIADNVGSLF